MWLTTERARQRLAQEKKLFVSTSEGEIPVCLICPNRYPVGMANLGFQAAYRILSQDPRCRGERAFLPDLDEAEALGRATTPLASLESRVGWVATHLTRLHADDQRRSLSGGDA